MATGTDRAKADEDGDNGCILRMMAGRSDLVVCVAGRRYGYLRIVVVHP
jgi:hypothetical protein